MNETLEHVSIDEITEFLGRLAGVLVLRPRPGDGSPEISWGDLFFYYAPDGVVPTAGQPFATIVSKDYPDDAGSRLSRPGAFRLNFAAGREAVLSRAGREPAGAEPDLSAADVIFAHPVYGSLGWLAVVSPGARTGPAVRELLLAAHDSARARYRRRGGSVGGAAPVEDGGEGREDHQEGA
jgi:hypothetical protein